jgi:large subunit ribosomal protein L6
MSRIGKQEITIPDGVDIKIESSPLGTKVTTKGPKGELERVFSKDIIITKEANIVKVTRANEERKTRSIHGLTRTLLANMIEGVKNGFSKDLEIHGVGYRATLKGANLDFQLGKSHPVVIEPPKGITFIVNENTKLSVNGPDKELVGQVCANIIALRPPEPYKGKGIRVKGQKIKRKAGKSGSK